MQADQGPTTGCSDSNTGPNANPNSNSGPNSNSEPDARSDPNSNLSADRLGSAMLAVGWSAKELARRLGSDYQSIRKMATGRRHIPDTLLGWIEPLGAAVSAVPVAVIDDATASDMTGADLATHLDAIGWNYDEATRRGAADKAEMLAMLKGRRLIGASLATYVLNVAAVIAAHPARPTGWGSPGRHAVRGC